MLSLSFVILAVALLFAVTEQACPTGTARVTDATNGKSWCISAYPTYMSFCDAVKTCHANGQEMISKPVFDAMKNYPAQFQSPPYWWVGLTDALNERDMSKDGWVWMLDGTVTATNDTDFDITEPNNTGGQQDCVTAMQLVPQLDLRDTSCMSLGLTYCYTRDPPVLAPFTTESQFVAANITDYTQPDPGCWILSSNVLNQLQCTLACFAFGFSDCVGFYWNSARRECIVLPYFDASVLLSFSSESEKTQWKKFIRTN